MSLSSHSTTTTEASPSYTPHRVFRYLYFVNDLRNVDVNTIYQKVGSNTHFSASYIFSLFASVVVCTLGLLLNAPAIVIGGMIISPLMWPLMKISVGVSSARRSLVYQALALLIFSIIFSLITAFFITFISPLKIINDEIIARTTPTLLDIIVALAAGSIAALGIMQTKVSDSLAGVAIAISLMPPLCVAGIGLALTNMNVFTGGFLLFITNVVSIIFISTLIFTLHGVRSETNPSFKRKGLAFITLVLFLTAIPLFAYLRSVTFKSNAYQIIQTTLTREFEQISPNIHVQNIKSNITPQGDKQLITIDAEILIPEDIAIDYNQQQSIIQELEDNLQSIVDLQLTMQKTISLVSEQERQNGSIRKQITDGFTAQVNSKFPSVKIDSLVVSRDDQQPKWNISAVLRADPNIQITEQDRQIIEAQLSKANKVALTLSMEIVSRVRLKSEPELQNETIRRTITQYLTKNIEGIDVDQVSLSFPQAEIESDQKSSTTSANIEKRIDAIIVMRIPQNTLIPSDLYTDLKLLIDRTFGVDVRLNINTIEKVTTTIE